MDVNKFFEEFVLKYPPYQNNRVFQILLTKFKDIFVNSSYIELPNILKKLYENSEIPQDVYNQFLIDMGVSKSLINELTTNEKLIFIKALADFQKYKGTVNIVQKVVKAYGNSAEVYELYVDYNKNYNRWECKPYLLYKPTYSSGYNHTIPYRLVYEKIPSLLIHETQLNHIRSLNLAVFPLKTNIIFVTSNYNESITSIIQNLIISTFYKYYYNDTINLFFENKLIQCTLHQFILIWLYIIFSKNNNYLESKLTGFHILFNKDLLTQSIEDLNNIILEYDSIQTLTELDNFYYNYIYPYRQELTSSSIVLDKYKIEQWLKSENQILISYVKDHLTPTNIHEMLNDLILSLELHKSNHPDSNFPKYFSYFKSFLASVDVIPAHSTIYKILYYLKPYHTEFLDLTDLSLIISDDKFNNIYFDHIYTHTNMLFKSASVIDIESSILSPFNYTHIVDNVNSISVGIPMSIHMLAIDDEYYLEDEYSEI